MLYLSSSSFTSITFVLAHYTYKLYKKINKPEYKVYTINLTIVQTKGERLIMYLCTSYMRLCSFCYISYNPYECKYCGVKVSAGTCKAKKNIAF